MSALVHRDLDEPPPSYDDYLNETTAQLRVDELPAEVSRIDQTLR